MAAVADVSAAGLLIGQRLLVYELACRLSGLGGTWRSQDCGDDGACAAASAAGACTRGGGGGGQGHTNVLGCDNLAGEDRTRPL